MKRTWPRRNTKERPTHGRAEGEDGGRETRSERQGQGAAQDRPEADRPQGAAQEGSSDGQRGGKGGVDRSERERRAPNSCEGIRRRPVLLPGEPCREHGSQRRPKAHRARARTHDGASEGRDTEVVLTDGRRPALLSRLASA